MARKNNRLTPIIYILLCAVVITALVRHFHIKNFKIVEPEVLYTSGQPRGMDYTRLLYKYHIATVINVRCAEEHREQNWYHEEIAWMRENGINYVELPIERTDRSRQFPNNSTQRKFLEIMSDPKNLPVLIHGSSGKKRESMLSAVWLIRQKGCSVDQAANIAEYIKEKPIVETEMDFLKALAK